MAGTAAQGQVVVTGQITANNVDTAILLGGGFSVKVTNLNGAAPIWYTTSTRGGSCPTPVIGGGNNANNFCAASVAGTSVSSRGPFQYGAIVQLTSTGTPTYQVELQGNHATS